MPFKRESVLLSFVLYGWFASLIVSSEKHQAAEHYPYALRQVVPREKNLSLMGLAEAQLA
ncbi:hypothetical protein [Bartonella quintana]|uniref:hypothetical protein n=1 Tax=Bartonella quintana TaxID=803 RepID=UPI0035E3D3DF